MHSKRISSIDVLAPKRMSKRQKNKFTFKIIFSYLILSFLAAVSGYFIVTEIRTYTSSKTAIENDKKLLKTGSFLTELYEAESLSKIALRSKTKTSFSRYTEKIAAILLQIDALKQLTKNANQKSLLDSVQLLLRQKVTNSKDFIAFKTNSDPNTSINDAIKEFQKMEDSYGKLTMENFEKNPEKLTPYKRKVLQDWVAYLNANIPSDSTTLPNANTIDSIIHISKIVLAKAKTNNSKAQRSLEQKELRLSQNDVELSKQLQHILLAFEQEVILNSFHTNLKKQAALKRSIRLAGFAALLGLLVVAAFVFLINRDFWKIQTYRNQLEDEKKYSDSLLKSREQLISTVSHDLRSPLNTISGYTDLLENTELTSKQLSYLKNVKSSSNYVANLVNDLLDFSKLDAGKLKIEKIPFIAAHLIKETAEHLETLSSEKGIRLHLEIDPVLKKPVLGDPFRMRQILSNLIGNAFKFTEHGFVKITADWKSEQKFAELEIKVIDSGIGIAEDKQEFIFKEFTQAETDTEKKFGGYGLGLTISRKLAELLGGSLELESIQDKGSTFTLRLPIEPSTRVQRQKEEEVSFMPQKLRLLIIDDDTALVQMLKELAESMGVLVHTFTNFLNVKRDARMAYDLVLTDIQMPHVTGFEVLKKLKSGTYNHYTSQPIIAMTGRRDLALKTYTSMGFTKIVQKPFSKEEFVSILDLVSIKVGEKVQEGTRKRQRYDNAGSYDLERIHAFLGTDEDAIFSVLQTFISDTNTNMEVLKDGFEKEDFEHIKQVAHRMLPMFRQLNVTSCIAILETMELLEKESLDSYAFCALHNKFNENVALLLAELTARSTIRLDYSD